MRRQLLSVAVLTALSQAAGFLKLWWTARLFGVGAELDGYFLALVLPTMIAGILSGALQTALFPVRARLAVEQDPAAVERFERLVLLGMLALGLLIAGAIVVARPWILDGIAAQATPGVRAVAAFVLPYAASLVVFNAVGDALGYLLAMRDRYPAAAAAPIANALLGAWLLAAWPSGGLFNLALGTVLGLALQVGICLLALCRSGFALWGPLPTLPEAAGYWGKMARLAGWILPGVAFANLKASLPPMLVASYGEGAVSAFGYAWRLHTSLVQVLVMAASPLILARFSRLHAASDSAAMARILRQAFVVSFAVGATAWVLVWGLGTPLLAAVFGDRFDAVAAARVGALWAWLTAGLAFSLLGNVYAKLWQAQARPRLLSALAGFSLLTFGAAYWIFAHWLNEQAIAGALVVAEATVVIAGRRFLDSPALAGSVRPLAPANPTAKVSR